VLGSEVPDLATTPCTGCGESLAAVQAGEIRWDPWHKADSRLAALPYHRACAEGAGVLPPTEPGPEQRACGRCLQDLGSELESAYRALHDRFLAAKAPLTQVEIVWRVAARDPRRFVPEHFACILNALPKKEGRQIEGSLGGEPGPNSEE
jgi:hypothetical protein